MADSLKLALASSLACVVAWSGCLSSFGETGNTAAFLLYYIWPVLSAVLSFLSAVFSVDDIHHGRRWTAGAGLVISVVVTAFTWTHFHGWE
jgi:hypothetical protein